MIKRHEAHNQKSIQSINYFNFQVLKLLRNGNFVIAIRATRDDHYYFKLNKLHMPKPFRKL